MIIDYSVAGRGFGSSHDTCRGRHRASDSTFRPRHGERIKAVASSNESLKVCVMKKSYHIVEMESFDGEDVFVHCGTIGGGQDHLFAIVVINEDGTAGIVDNGYRSVEEARGTWPKAK